MKRLLDCTVKLWTLILTMSSLMLNSSVIEHWLDQRLLAVVSGFFVFVCCGFCLFLVGFVSVFFCFWCVIFV
jgi:hypothetical protein